MMVPKEVTKNDAWTLAKADCAVAKWLEGMASVKVNLVKGRLLTIVVRPA